MEQLQLTPTEDYCYTVIIREHTGEVTIGKIREYYLGVVGVCDNVVHLIGIREYA